MISPFGTYRRNTLSGVLVLALLVLALISVIVLGLLASVTAERQGTEANYQQRRALTLAMLAFQTGVAQLREALGTGTNSWDDPYGNFATNPPAFFWSVSPGIISRWNYANATPANYPLFSYTSDGSNTNLVNLNRPVADGSYPIIGGANPPDVSVQFVNVLQDPSQAAGPNNMIVGRYAFWIDDESAKININVADGSRTKYSDDWVKNSLGIGSPTEVSLSVLTQGGAGILAGEASNIVATARTTSFHSPREILRVPLTAPDLYTDNIFNITDDSRSPDLNVFGQPKMAIEPILGDSQNRLGPGVADGEGTNMVINGITLQPATEIYPTPKQLAPYAVPATIPGNPAVINPWPMAFRGMWTATTMDPRWGPGGDGVTWGYTRDTNFPYNNGALIANYLAGTNGAGMPVTWPAFPGATAPAGFFSKYSDRQIDEIAVQIVSLGSRLISSDYAYAMPGDYPASYNLNTFDQGDMSRFQGDRFKCAALIFPGWLSHQWVIGMGRGAKVTRLTMEFDQVSQYEAPYGPQLTIHSAMEQWIPAAYRGGQPTPRPQYEATYDLGLIGNYFTLNPSDMNQGAPSSTGPATPSLIPKAAPDANGNTNSYWANQLLSCNQIIDFNCNFPQYADPDQILATNHSWCMATPPPNPTYNGVGPGLPPPFFMASIKESGPYTEEWGANPDNYPGEARCVLDEQVHEGVPSYLFMSTNAGVGANTSAVFTGGVSIQAAEFIENFSDADPVPLETIRGANSGTDAAQIYMTDLVVDSINHANPDWNCTNGMTGKAGFPGGAGSNLRQRHVASVIPFVDSKTGQTPSVSISPVGTIPGAGSSCSVYAYASDPLVNKFPGDWVVSVGPNSTTLIPGDATPPGYLASFYEMYQAYPEAESIRAMITSETPAGDPDSYWLPQMDAGMTATTASLATQTLIPRSARMPNIGYLQYVRTGIIPDDETNTAYQQQHGTPFRLLSYAPAGDAAQTVHGNAYPDWAMLDLFYVPSVLDSYGGPYAADTNLASFGTYGGATAGRINPNGAVIYTTDVNHPQTNVLRVLPIEATLQGLQVGQTTSGSVANPQQWGWSGGTPVDAPTVASNIAYFISTNGPLRMPAEICDIPAVSALHASVNATRNDLVRQMVGELTTQSNVFSVWTVGQTIHKATGNTTYGEVESGDQIVGEVRLHLIVERYLDPGADGVYGNTANPGFDGIVNTFDDPVDPVNHPFQPKYLYRIVRSEEIH